LNLFLNKYVEEIQLPDIGIWMLSKPQRLYTQSSDMAWHWWLTNKGSCSWQVLAACTNPGCSKPFLSFLHSAKHAPPHLSSS
jgi:hypothetical protein